MNRFNSKAVSDAYTRISPHILQTPFEKSVGLSRHVNVYLKHEEMQYSGSFKLRGALSKVSSLSKDDLKKGVVTASTGNHGLATSRASKIFGTRAQVFLPQTTDADKKAKIRAYGAEIHEVDGDCLKAELAARAYAEKNGQVYISPYNDETVVAGQGTVAVEILKQLGEMKLDAIFITVGGGGLISGAAGYLKEKSPQTKVFGCWPENARAMYECLRVGKIVDVPEEPTFSVSSSGGVEPGSVTFEMCRDFIDEKILVSESEIRTAVREIAKYEDAIVEGAAGVALAAFHQVEKHWVGKNVAILLCGRNVPLEDFETMIKK